MSLALKSQSLFLLLRGQLHRLFHPPVLWGIPKHPQHSTTLSLQSYCILFLENKSLEGMGLSEPHMSRSAEGNDALADPEHACPFLPLRLQSLRGCSRRVPSLHPFLRHLRQQGSLPHSHTGSPYTKVAFSLLSQIWWNLSPIPHAGTPQPKLIPSFSNRTEGKMDLRLSIPPLSCYMKPREVKTHPETQTGIF